MGGLVGMVGHFGPAVIHFIHQDCLLQFIDKFALKSIILKQPANMIDGLPLKDIERNDYYRRFVVLKLLLKRWKVGANEQTDDARRYEQIEMELQAMEEHFKARSTQGKMINAQTIVKIDDLHSNLTHLIAKVKDKKETFEDDLLKKWRAALIVKKKREAESKKVKDAKSTSNKNLMYLTSQLLKKERMSARNIRCHEQKIKGIHGTIEEQLKEADSQFRSKYDQLKELMKSERSRVQGMIEQYKQSLQTEQQLFSAQIQQKIGKIKKELLSQHDLFVSNSKGIKEILSALASKN